MTTNVNPHPWDGTHAGALRSLTLSAARNDFADGDLLLWRGQYLVSKFFERWTNGRYSHAALVANWDDTQMVLQAEAPYIQAVPLRRTVRKYPGSVYWYKLAPEYESGIDVEKVLHEARRYLGRSFGYLDIFRDMMHRRFHWPLPHDPKKPKAMFCSEYVSHCFRTGGMPIVPDREDMDTLPSDIAESKNLVFQATLKPDPE
jgi:hypothetical protein